MHKLYNCGMWKMRNVKIGACENLICISADRKLIVVGEQISDPNNTITSSFPYL